MIQGQIAKGAIISYIAIFSNIAITFFYTPWMIRQIGMSDYALYGLIASFISYFIIDFGLSGTVTRYIAKYRSDGNVKKIEETLGLAMKAYLFIDAVIFVVLLSCYFFLSSIFTGLTLEEIEKLKILYIIAGIFSVLTFVWHPMNGAMMAYEFFVENKMIDLLQRLFVVLLVVLLLYNDGNVYDLIFVTGAGGFISSLFKFYVFRKKSNIHIKLSYFDHKEAKNLLSFSFWVFLIGLAQRFRLNFIPTILGILSNSIQISLFTLGMTIEGITYTISTALNGLFLPKVTRLINNNSSSQLNELIIRVGRIQLFVISLVISAFLLVGHEFLYLWVGHEFSNTYFVVSFLIATNIVALTQHVMNDVVYAENKIKRTAVYTLFASSLCLIGSIILAPRFGAVGCSLSYFLGMSLNLVLINLFYKKELKIDVWNFFRNCHFKILPLHIVLFFSFYVAKYFLSINSWIMLICFTLVYVCAYFCVSFFLLFNQSEKSLIYCLLKK